MVEFSLRDPAIVSYGLGTLAFIAFSAHLGLGWRGGLRASILLGTIVISAVWAALNLGYALTDRPAFWTGQAVLDASRIGGWLLFVGLLLGGQRAAAGARIRQAANATAGTLSQGARDSAPPGGGTWWAAALLVLPAAAWFFPPPPRCGNWHRQLHCPVCPMASSSAYR